MAKTEYGYWFICNKCGMKNTTTRDKPDKEQIQQKCSNEDCGMTSYYTRPGFRGHHGNHSNLYLEDETAETTAPHETTKLSTLIKEPANDYLPTKEDFESAYRMLTRPGIEISVDTILDKIETDANAKGLLLQDNWRMITEKNIGIWSKKG